MTVSPVSSRRRVSTGPSRWKKRCRLPSAGPSSRAPGIPSLASRADDREVGHQRELEATAERVRLDLRDGDLREGQELVVEAEALAVDAEAPALARPPLVGLVGPYQAYELAMSAPVLNTPSRRAG